MSKKNNYFSFLMKISGIVGVVATIIFGINQWNRSEEQVNETKGASKLDSITKKNIEINDKGTYIEGNQTNVYNGDNSMSNEIRKFQKYVPEFYLSQLPGIKENAYSEAKELWNTGITSEMMKGNYLVLDRLIETLTDLAETAYSPDFFNGKSAKEYYSEKIEKMSKAAYDSQTEPESKGTIGLVTGSGNLRHLADEFIVEIVRDVSEPSYFINWKKEWDIASKKASGDRE